MMSLIEVIVATIVLGIKVITVSMSGRKLKDKIDHYKFILPHMTSKNYFFVSINSLHYRLYLISKLWNLVQFCMGEFELITSIFCPLKPYLSYFICGVKF